MIQNSHTFAELALYEIEAVNSAQGFYIAGTPRCYCDYRNSCGAAFADPEQGENQSATH